METRLRSLATIAQTEFTDIIYAAVVIDAKLRLVLVDTSFIDFWWSKGLPGRFAYHWERRHVDGTIYRHDNAPHPQWQYVSSFPRHFHYEKDSNVIVSDLSLDPTTAVRQFLSFARAKLVEKAQANSSPLPPI